MAEKIDTEFCEYPTCPYCGDQLTEAEDYGCVTTYWGDDGRKSLCCLECNRDYEVDEHVSRTWSSFPLARAGE